MIYFGFMFSDCKVSQRAESSKESALHFTTLHAHIYAHERNQGFADTIKLRMENEFLGLGNWALNREKMFFG